MKKIKLNIQLFAVNVNTHTFTEVANSYNATNKTIQVRYVLKLTTTGSSYNNNTITSSYWIDGTKYTSKHKLPKTSTTTIFDKTVAIPCTSNRTVSARYSVPTDISAGTMTGSKSLAIKKRIQPTSKIKVKKDLPAGYTQVDYITGNGPYIDTGYYAQPNSRFTVCYKFNSIPSANVSIFGATRGNSTVTTGLVCSFYRNGSGNWAWGLQDSDGNWYNTGVAVDTNQHTFILDSKNNGTCLDNGTHVDYISTTRTKSGLSTIGLSAQHNFDDTWNNICDVAIYYFLIYEDNILIHAFIPCYRNSDNKVGMYDILGNTFYSSVSGVEYTYGSVVSGGFWLDARVYGKSAGTWTAATNTYGKSGGAWGATHQVY